MGTTLDLHFEGNEMGWHTGTIDVYQAYNGWCNLDIANIGPDELFEEGTDTLLLGDLSEFKAGFFEHMSENRGSSVGYDEVY